MFRIRKTVCKMLTKRGYAVPSPELDMDAETFRARYSDSPNRDALNMLVAKNDEPDSKLHVNFVVSDFAMAECKRLVVVLQDKLCKHAIVVYGARISSAAKTALAVPTLGISVEYFKDEELLIDITEHELVPAHVILTTDEKKALLDRYKLRETQLPRMQLGDPVARYFGMKRGQVVKITRASETAGRYVTYRVVV